jgi:glycosyltransferase involved in cell wall biosynthesis
MLTILIPIRDDWDSLAQLVASIDSAVATLDAQVRVVIVDDASEGSPQPLAACSHLAGVDVLRLRGNVGHQRAISTGLAYCSTQLPESPILVMDGDGQDDPDDIPRLCAAFAAEGGDKVVFAERTRRVETSRFRFFYLLYRIAIWLLTGRRIRFGNFSVIPAARVKQLIVTTELPVHYAAAVVKSRIPHVLVPTERRPRISGASSMDFVALVVHGFNALSVFGEEVITRVLLAGGTIMAACVAGAVTVTSVRLFTDLAVPGWATYVLALLAVIFLQTVAICFVTSFVVLNLKRQAPMIPERDHALLVESFHPYPGLGDA